MTYALNELESLLKKAAIGAGFPVEHASAIAAAGVWLARRGFPACEIVCRALAGGMRDGVIGRSGAATSFQTARAGVDGLAAIDLLLADAAGDAAILHDVDEPALLLGLAGVAAGTYGVGFVFGTGEEEVVIGSGVGIAAADFNLSGGCTIALGLRAELPGGDDAELVGRYDPAATADGGWAQLEQLARKTYVPASDLSRLSGAGAGLTDND